MTHELTWDDTPDALAAMFETALGVPNLQRRLLPLCVALKDLPPDDERNVRVHAAVHRLSDLILAGVLEGDELTEPRVELAAALARLLT